MFHQTQEHAAQLGVGTPESAAEDVDVSVPFHRIFFIEANLGHMRAAEDNTGDVAVVRQDGFSPAKSGVLCQFTWGLAHS